MARYFVASGGSNTSPYDTWAKAATSLATALAAATANGDEVIIQYNAVPTADSAVSANTTWTIAGNIDLISASNDGGSAFTPTPMGATYWLGSSSGSYTLNLRGAYRWRAYGITLRNAGTANATISVAISGGDAECVDCYFWLGTTNTTSVIVTSLGGIIETSNVFRGCTFRWGDAAQGLNGGGAFCRFTDCIMAAPTGATPNYLVRSSGNAGLVEFYDSDLNFGTALVEDMSSGSKRVVLVGCTLPSGATLLAAQTTYGNESQAEVIAYDSAFGDIHYAFVHQTPAGSTEVVNTIYLADGATYDGTNAFSWKIVSSAIVSMARPYVSPWVEVYHDGVSAITPYLECMRDNSAGAVFQNDEVWSEFTYKGTTSSVRSTYVDDRMAYGGTPADQTASSKTATDWTGETGTPGLFKTGPASSITPAEIGSLRARVCVGAPSITVYVDPQIRT